MQQAARVIKIQVDTKGAEGLKRVSQQLGKVSKDVKRTANVATRLQRAFGALAAFSFAGFGIGRLVRASDEIQLLRDRITAFEGSAELANMRIEQLAEVANTTAAPLGVLATSYNRLALALTDTGISGEALLGITKALQQSFRIAGAGIGEIRGAVIQLSQGLASGQLRGQELRSVLEANAVIGGILAKQLGVTRGELLKFSEKRGGISAQETIAALSNNFDSLNKRAGNLSLTIEQTLAIAFNKLQVGILRANDALGISKGFSKTILFLTENGLPLLSVALGVTLVLAANKALIAIGLLNSGLTLTQFLTVSLIRVLGTISAAIAFLATPIGLAAIALSGILLIFTDLEKAQLIAEKALASIAKAFIDTLVFIGKSVASIPVVGDILNEKLGLDGIIDNFELLSKVTGATIADLGRQLDDISKLRVEEALAKELEKLQKKVDSGAIDSLKDLNRAYSQGIISLDRYNQELIKLKETDIFSDFNDGNIAIREREKRLSSVRDEVFGLTGTFSKLNKELERTGDLEAYSKGLRDLDLESLNKRFEEGKISLEDFQKGLDEQKLGSYRRELNSTSISIAQYRESVRGLEQEQLNRKLRDGRIDLIEYNRELVSVSEKFRPGAAIIAGSADAIDAAGTLSKNIAEAISNTFSSLEDTLVDFVKKGKFEFAALTQSILDDLTRVIIRASIIQPLAKGILRAVGGGGGAVGGGTPPLGGGSFSPTITQAKGGAWENGVQKFASGGVVNSPTFFGTSSGQGLMGEAGPEAILPLKRTSGGDLGVKAASPNVNINIVNNTSAQVEQREGVNGKGDRTIDFIIVNKVKEGLSRGDFDKQFSTQYGLRRRGS